MLESHFKRVLFFEGNPKVGFGGGQKVSLDAVKAFVEQGLEVHFINLGKKNVFSKEMEAISTSSLQLFEHSFLFKLISLSLFVKHRHCTPYDTFIYSAVKPGDFFALFLKFIFGYKVLLHVHMLKEVLPKTHQILMSYIYTFADKLIFVSQTVQNSWRIGNSSFIYNQVETFPDIAAKRKEKIETLALVGHLIPQKGIEKFLEDNENELLRKKIKVYVWGEGLDQEKLNSRFPWAFWKGFSREFKQELKELDLLVFSSTQPEAFGLTVVEAASLGLPSISTNLGGQEEVSQALFGRGCTYNPYLENDFWRVFDFVERNYVFLAAKGLNQSRHLFNPEVFQDKILNVIGKF